MNESKSGLTAAHLRLLALGLMLIDHSGRVLFPGQVWMIALGRLAFPIFAFQTAEGYHHTHNFRRYCLRLALFALVSEIPFNLMISGTVLFPGHQNVMLTLLLGLLTCRAYDRRRWGAVAGWIILGAVTLCDYGSLGVVTVLMFHIFRGQKLCQLLMLIAINYFGYEGQHLLLGRMEIPVQAFAILAFIPIFLYNGEKGRGGKALQYGSYVFYPLHMLILWLL